MSLLPRKFFSLLIIKIAFPAIAGLSAQVIVSLVDTAMVGRLENSEYALAAMGLGVLATWAIVSFFSALATGTHVLTANYYGKKDFNECGNILLHSIITAVAIGSIITLLGVFFSYNIAHTFAKDATVGNLAADYMFYRLLGIPFFLITVSFRGFYFGIGNTKIFMISGLIVNTLNIFFNYIFIYGEFGIEPMGLAGAGLGSTLATIADSIFYISVSLSGHIRKNFFSLKKIKLNSHIFKSLYRLSIPVSFQSVFILVGFLSFVAITGLIGIIQQAATQAVISTLFLSFLPCFGFGIAVQTLVGNNVGRGKIKLAKIFGYEAAKIASIYTLFLALIYIVFPEVLLLITTNNYEIIQVAKPAMRIAGFAQIFYATGVVLANGLQSIGKTAYVMAAEGITNLFVFLPISYFLGVYLELGLIGAWIGLPVYIILYSALIYIRFRFSRWQTSSSLSV